MNPKRRIALLTRDAGLSGLLTLRLDSKGYQAVCLPEPTQALAFVYADPPDLVIIDFSSLDHAYHQVLLDLKQDNYFSIIPVIGIIDAAAVDTLAWDQYPVDDFVTGPVDWRELFGRIRLSFERVQWIFDNNPLTKLPGNTSIQRAIEKSIGRPVAVCTIDIKHFKTYNDTYGFERGDEVLRMVARIMANTVKEARDGGFVGHVGGDDFVFIAPLGDAEKIAQTIIDRFKVITADLFGGEDIARGYYVAKDRRGEPQQTPLLGISICVVPMDNPIIRHAGKVADIAAELKQKREIKSKINCYVVDRRRAVGLEYSMLDLGLEEKG